MIPNKRDLYVLLPTFVTEMGVAVAAGHVVTAGRPLYIHLTYRQLKDLSSNIDHYLYNEHQRYQGK